MVVFLISTDDSGVCLTPQTTSERALSGFLAGRYRLPETLVFAAALSGSTTTGRRAGTRRRATPRAAWQAKGSAFFRGERHAGRGCQIARDFDSGDSYGVGFGPQRECPPSCAEMARAALFVASA